MKLGIGSYTYMWSIGFERARPAQPMTASDLLERARQRGVRVVQFGPNLPLEGVDLERLGAEAADAGIEVELGATGLTPAQLEAPLAACRRLGATLLRSVDLYEGAPPSAREFERSCRAVLPLLGDYGIRLAIENARIPAAVMAQALDAIGSPWLGVTLDTVNSLAIPEGAEHVARTLAGHTICLHIKDFTVKRIWHMMGFTVEGAAAGRGQLNVPWLLETLRAAGADPNAILELWVPEQASLEETIALEHSWAIESLAYLRALIPD